MMPESKILCFPYILNQEVPKESIQLKKRKRKKKMRNHTRGSEKNVKDVVTGRLP